MKQKLLALVFLLAFAITPFLAFGGHSALALTVTTPGSCVEAPDPAVGGGVTAFSNVTAHTSVVPLDFNFTSDSC